MAKTVKRIRAKKKTLRFLVFGFACFFAIGTLLVYLSQMWITTYEKYQEKKMLDRKLILLMEQEEVLTINVKKLKDPEYIARYLREKYFYSKDGEYIIRIPEDSSK